MKTLRRIGNFYTRIIMNNVGIFIFVGLLSVLFHEQGWFPNENMYALSQFVYHWILPVLIALEGGRLIGGKEGNISGGILAVLTVGGMLMKDTDAGIFAAMIAGPAAGSLWKLVDQKIRQSVNPGIQMLVRNLCLGILGALLAALGMWAIVPVLNVLAGGLYRGVDFLVQQKMTWLLSFLIEPAKVFFLNNVTNYAILVPLGMQQVQETGKSILFLLEANPGPGLGVLLALYWKLKEEKKKQELAAAIVTEAAGGIHEVYFPYVWSNFRLLLPLILGGVSGTICFSLLGAGVQGVVSPGSIVTLLLMSGRSSLIPVLAGIFVSAVVAFYGGLLVLGSGKKESVSDDEGEKLDGEEGEKAKEPIWNFDCDNTEQDKENGRNLVGGASEISEAEKQDLAEAGLEKSNCGASNLADSEADGKEIAGFETEKRKCEEGIEETIATHTSPLQKIAVVCNGGMGSSAMGAAVFRRLLRQEQITDVTVDAYAADLVPDTAQIIVCQKDYRPLLPKELDGREIYTVESLMQAELYRPLLEKIQRRNGGSPWKSEQE